MKNKTYLFLAIYGVQEQVLVDIRTIEKRNMKKMKDNHTKKCTESRIRKKSSRIPDPGGKKAPDPNWIRNTDKLLS
jgi:hypothetical protein